MQLLSKPKMNVLNDWKNTHARNTITVTVYKKYKIIDSHC